MFHVHFLFYLAMVTLPQSIQQQLYIFFISSYPVEVLRNGFFAHVRIFLKTNQAFCLEQGVPEEFIAYSLKNSYPHFEIARMCTIPFLSQALFDRFRETLTPEICKIIDYLLWNRAADNKIIQQKLGIAICEKKHNYSYGIDLLKPYRFFSFSSVGYSHNEIYILYIPVFLRRIMALYYAKPAAANIVGIDTIPNTDHIFEGEKYIFDDIMSVSLYVAQGNVTTTARGEVAATGFKKLDNALRLNEFYPNTDVKDLRYLRTRLITAMALLGKDLQIEKNPVQHLKNLFRRYPHFDHLHLLTYLKKRNLVAKDKDVYANYLTIAKALPIKQWVLVDNLIEYAKYNIISLLPADAKTLVFHAKYEIDNNTFDVSETTITDVVEKPSLHATLFLWAALGLIDIAYNNPTPDNQVPSPYNGVQYVRLNELGAYLFGIADNYKAPELKVIPNLVLSPETLTITAHPDDKTATLLLAPYANKTAVQNVYITNYSIFMHNCNNLAQLKNKIINFKSAVKDIDIPANWQQFFTNMLAQANVFKEAGSHRLIQIPAENTNLARLIARDAELKKYIIKAEEYYIIVFSKNESAVKKHLKELGYLWD